MKRPPGPPSPRPLPPASPGRPGTAPPASAPPTALSISDVTTLLADPYAIYARRVLGIRELPALYEESDQSQFGDIVHAGLAAFFADPAHVAAPDAAHRLAQALHQAMRGALPRAALEQWWAARLERIAGCISKPSKSAAPLSGGRSPSLWKNPRK